MRVHVLGCYAATPRSYNNPTAQVLELPKNLFLIDCGEGTQVAFRRKKLKFSRLEHIFISHLHGDHFFGLPGLVSTLRLLGRDKALTIHGPKGIKEAITLLLKLGDSWTDYPLYFNELDSKSSEVILELENLRVSTIPLEHRIYTNGFLFETKQKSENNWQPQYAYCSDTKYSEHIAPLIQEVKCLYHESTFLAEEERLCDYTKHSSARQAAMVAKQANAQNLLLGHYSTRYKDLNLFRLEAETIFKNVLLAEDGATFDF